jgi:putative flippase GtrA
MNSDRKQLIGFIITGAFSTLIMFVLYILLYRIINYQYAYLISYTTSVIILYFMNSAVFKKPLSLSTFFKFPLIYLAQYIIGAVSLELIVKLGFSITFAPLLVVIMLFPITFLLNRLVLSR